MKQTIVSPGAITKIDNDLHALAKSIGRVVDGNKSTSGASSGQFVVLLNSTISGRADGLYTASKAIPANTAIDSSYLTASNDGGLNALNSNFGTLKVYTPNITSGSPGFEASNISFYYMQTGKLLFLSGRFNITNVGSSPNQNTVSFTLPTGLSCGDIVGSSGSIALNKAGVDISKFSVRQGTNSFYIQEGAGGTNVLSVIGTGYVMLYATIMLN